MDSQRNPAGHGDPARRHLPQRHRDPGDAWVEGPDGTRMWGRFGSAGLLASDPQRGVLLQHRAEWSHFGGTWGIPGGARHEGESAVAAALREAGEEAGVPDDVLAPLFTYVLDLGYWTYTTAAARTLRPFEPRITDDESLELTWLPLPDVDAWPLHPHFATAWPRLRGLLEQPPMLVVDAANVVGSRPDGWWRDRAGAAERLLSRLVNSLGDDSGLPATLMGIGDADDDGARVERMWPGTVVVLEGPAVHAGASGRAIRLPATIEVVRAQGSGDDEIVRQVERFNAAGRGSTGRGAGVPRVTVVTSDRELRRRVEAAGARSVGPRQLWDTLQEA